MLLIADQIRLGEPFPELFVDISRLTQPEYVHVISRGERLDAPEPRMIDAARENEMAVEPSVARGDLRERHAHLERDARLLGQNTDRTDRANRRHHLVEQRTNCRRLAAKMMAEREAATGVCLVAVGERPPACVAFPQPRPPRSGQGGS